MIYLKTKLIKKVQQTQHARLFLSSEANISMPNYYLFEYFDEVLMKLSDFLIIYLYILFFIA